MFKWVTFILLALALMGCEIGNRRSHVRTPHMPVFPEVTEGKRSKSNPYWNRWTSYFDKTEIKLDNGNTHTVDHPSLVGSLGTHYRFPQDFYVYAITGGVGAQNDWFLWNGAKVGLGLYAGVTNNYGGQLIFAHEVGEIFNGKTTVYFAVQRQDIEVNVVCLGDALNKCATGDPVGKNQVRARHDVLNSLAGVEFGRFKIGDKGSVTVNFRVEVGVQEVLSAKVVRENFPSAYIWQTSSQMVSAHADFTLW